MIIIQIVLVVGFILFLYSVLANPSSSQLRAWVKIFAILFVVIAIATVIYPNSTNTIANWVGVKRGADLLLYMLTLAFIFAMFKTYTQEKKMQKQITVLVRRIAKLEANSRYQANNKKKK